MSATLTNGKPQRKQLADQLDRLDVIIDALADALPEAVADAVKDGARQAVKEAVLELLTNPDLRAVLARPAADPAPSAPPAPPKPSVWTRLKARLGEARRRAVDAVRPVVGAAAAKCRAAAPAAAAVGHAVRRAWGLRRPVLVAAAVGAAVAAASYAAPPAVSAAIGGVGGLCTALAVQGGLWVRATARQLGLV